MRATEVFMVAFADNQSVVNYYTAYQWIGRDFAEPHNAQIKASLDKNVVDHYCAKI
jgi:hypothetical protein